VSAYTPIELLDNHHVIEGFRCGEPSLDDWLALRARANQLSGYSRTYVTTDGTRVVGYYALSSISVLRTHTPRRVRKEAPRDIPAVLLGRLAVDDGHQKVGLGSELLDHAMAATVEASKVIGVRLLVVNALHEEACAFYRRIGFHRSPTNPLDLMLTVQEIEDAL
jgi:ribosomal protein S18 acetylase RimI-like enzyme